MSAPIVAIVGSVREEIVQDDSLRQEAVQACEKLGAELAIKGVRIAVYEPLPRAAETHFVRGYVGSGHAQPKSIVTYSLGDTFGDFDEQKEHRGLFSVEAARDDWEIGFFSSFADVDGIIIVGGGSSTLSAAFVCLSRESPPALVALRKFGGSGKKVFQYLQDRGKVPDESINAMNNWESDTASQCVDYLVSSYDEASRQRKSKKAHEAELAEKAKKWDERVDLAKAKRLQSIAAAVALLVFILVLILGLSIAELGSSLIAIFVMGLSVAGGAGGSVRMLRPAAPDSSILRTLTLGVTAGLIISFFYLLPQLIGFPGFLETDPEKTAESLSSVRVQFLSAMLISFIAGLGFEYVVDGLQKAGQNKADAILEKTDT